MEERKVSAEAMDEMKELNHLPFIWWGFELFEGTIKGIIERKLVHGFAAQPCQSLRT